MHNIVSSLKIFRRQHRVPQDDLNQGTDAQVSFGPWSNFKFWKCSQLAGDLQTFFDIQPNNCLFSQTFQQFSKFPHWLVAYILNLNSKWLPQNCWCDFTRGTNQSCSQSFVPLDQQSQGVTISGMCHSMPWCHRCSLRLRRELDNQNLVISYCYFKTDALKTLVFRPLVKGNEALGMRLVTNW